jgi:glycosyltransferase involved in cell wall biosynthesis
MSPTSSVKQGGWMLPHRVIYVVSHSYPYSSNGYAVRTHEVARALAALGHDMIVINRPGRPWDIEGFPFGASVKTEQVIDGVRYVFLPSEVSPEMNRRARLRQAERALIEAFEVFRPGAVMAVSNWENAEPAQNAARRWGCRFFYEQRGFWELSHAACHAEDGAEDGAEDKDERAKGYIRDRENEVRIARGAQAVFTLNRAMGDELVRRGVPEGKIHLVPNGVSDPGPVAKGVDRASIGCTARHLLGYVGSLSSYEGGEDLIDLMARLRGDKVDVDLVIVGGSAPKGLIGSTHGAPLEDRLKAQAAELGIGAHIHFVPQVAQNRIGAYYSMVDAIIMPRRRTPVTELVAPLKPYAAAAYGVPVFMTDMAPLDEVAKDIHASLFPEGDIGALAKMVRHTLEHGGHPAVLNTLRPGVRWQRRVQPMSRLLKAAAEALPDLSGMSGTGTDAEPDTIPQGGRLFDAHILPRVALRNSIATGPVAAIGPCAHLGPDVPVTRLTRVNILAELATGNAGRFIIDWAGLQGGPEHDGEWAGLWMIDNMRLNRQVMDACRIALDRGWRLQVTGPVLRSRAPLFRTVSGVIEEILPTDGAKGAAEQTAKQTGATQ